VGLLAGGFNPPTIAHTALLSAAALQLDAVACVIPRAYPHKSFFGAGFEERLQMLSILGYPVLAANRGLFIEIAREFRNDIAPTRGVELYFICGRDAAERIVSWDYGGHPGEIDQQLDEYRLLVAARKGDFDAPRNLRHGIELLPVAEGFDDVSSTVVRELLAEGDERWVQHVPEALHEHVRRIYATR